MKEEHPNNPPFRRVAAKCALFLALVSVWGGLGHEGWVLWDCVSYLRDSGLVTLIVAPGGSLLLEDIRRDDG